MKFIMFLFMFLILGSLLIISNNDINFQKEGNLAVFGKSWAGWIEKVGSNIQTITGKAVALDWKPE